MSAAEVRWHAWRIKIGQLMRIGSAQGAETLIRDDLEAVAYFRPKHIEFEWQAKDSKAAGYIHFFDRSNEHDIEPAWVRTVCRSVRFSGKCFPNRMTKEDVRAEFHVVTE
jgi:hypothetical protein